jgi:hypothetical protein
MALAPGNIFETILGGATAQVEYLARMLGGRWQHRACCPSLEVSIDLRRLRRARRELPTHLDANRRRGV